MRAIVLLAMVAALLGVALAVSGAEPAPEVVIVCARGGVHRLNDEALLASAGPCVLHDRHGGTASADSISVYDNGIADH